MGLVSVIKKGNTDSVNINKDTNIKLLSLINLEQRISFKDVKKLPISLPRIIFKRIHFRNEKGVDIARDLGMHQQSISNNYIRAHSMIRIIKDLKLKNLGEDVLDYLMENTVFSMKEVLHIAGLFNQDYVSLKNFTRKNKVSIELVKKLKDDGLIEIVEKTRLRKKYSLVKDPKNAIQKIKEYKSKIKIKEDHWDKKDISFMLNISEAWVWELAKQGYLTYTKIRNTFYYNKKKNELFLTSYKKNKYGKIERYYLRNIFWNVKDLANILNLDKKSIYRLREKKYLAAIVFEGVWYFDKENEANKEFVENFEKWRHKKKKNNKHYFADSISDICSVINDKQLIKLYLTSKNEEVKDYIINKIENGNGAGTNLIKEADPEQIARLYLTPKFFKFVDDIAINFSKMCVDVDVNALKKYSHKVFPKIVNQIDINSDRWEKDLSIRMTDHLFSITTFYPNKIMEKRIQ